MISEMIKPFIRHKDQSKDEALLKKKFEEVTNSLGLRSSSYLVKSFGIRKPVMELSFSENKFVPIGLQFDIIRGVVLKDFYDDFSKVFEFKSSKFCKRERLLKACELDKIDRVEFFNQREVQFNNNSFHRFVISLSESLESVIMQHSQMMVS